MIELQLARLLKERGYSKRRLSWFRRTADTVVVVNLQRSAFGSPLYLNAGVWLLALGEADHPPEQRCHVRFRATQLLPPEDQRRWEREILDPACPTVSPHTRAEEIDTMIRDRLEPVLDRCGTLHSLRALWEETPILHLFTTKEARALLDSARAPPTETSTPRPPP